MFDPTKPQENTPLDAGEVRENFVSLKALIDVLLAQAEPVGTIKSWAKSFPGVPPLGAFWAECNGQVLSDAESPLDGATLPDLNGAPGRFLRGDTASGNVGGIDSFATVTANDSGGGGAHNCVSPDTSPGAVPFPPYYTVVWVMRVK